MNDRKWRNYDLQRDRREGPLLGSCEADFYGRHAGAQLPFAPRNAYVGFGSIPLKKSVSVATPHPRG